MPGNGYHPALVVPVLASCPKFFRFWSRCGGVSCDAEILDSRLVKGKNDVTDLDVAHVLIEAVEALISPTLGRPQIAPGYFMLGGLVLIDPPIRHLAPPLAPDTSLASSLPNTSRGVQGALLKTGRWAGSPPWQTKMRAELGKSS